MPSRSEFLIGPTSDYETWLTGIRSIGVLSSQGVESNVFKGSVRGSCMWGIIALETAFASPNIGRFERIRRDPRLNSSDYYNVVFQITGRSTLIQDDQETELAVGEIGLVDVARPVSLISGSTSCRWLSLSIPRQRLISHLGLEPRGGLCWHSATPACRLLFSLVSDAPGEDDRSYTAAEPYSSSRSTICSAPYSPGPIFRLIPRTLTGCSRASAASPGTTSQILTFPFAMWPAKQEFHCAISRSCSRRAD